MEINCFAIHIVGVGGTQVIVIEDFDPPKWMKSKRACAFINMCSDSF